MIQLAREQKLLTVSEKLYGELMNRWMVVELSDTNHLFIKHFHALNPHRNRYMLMQLILSDFPQGKYFEAVYEAHARMTKWVEQVVVNGMPYPKLSVNNGCFDVLQWQVFGESSYVTVSDLGKDKFNEFILSQGFTTKEELSNIQSQGVRAQKEWIKAIF